MLVIKYEFQKSCSSFPWVLSGWVLNKFCSARLQRVGSLFRIKSKLDWEFEFLISKISPHFLRFQKLFIIQFARIGTMRHYTTKNLAITRFYFSCLHVWSVDFKILRFSGDFNQKHNVRSDHFSESFILNILATGKPKTQVRAQFYILNLNYDLKSC